MTKSYTIESNGVSIVCTEISENNPAYMVAEIIDGGGTMIRFTGAPVVNADIPSDMLINMTILVKDGATRTQHPFFGVTFAETDDLKTHGAFFLGNLLATHMDTVVRELAVTNMHIESIETILDMYHDTIEASERIRDLNQRSLQMNANGGK